MDIRKAVFPAAGFGTRFLPVTKAIPKEMLPLLDKPLIQYSVEEAKESGLEEVIIVTGMGKTAIEDHFDVSFELEILLKEKNKTDILKMVEEVSNLIHFSYTRQKKPLGLGHAIHCAKNLGPRFYKVIDMVEKPHPKNAPSNLAIIGRYILTPEIFDALEETRPGKGGEIQLTDGLRKLSKKQPIYAYEFEGDRYDAGDKLGFLMANVSFALNRGDIKKEFRRFLKGLDI